MTGIISSTNTDITGLTNGETYNFSVAATAGVHILPGVSEERGITLGELINVMRLLLSNHSFYHSSRHS